ncbi:hypothetical protein CVIRNUC_001689 [Coccomyxa viridis]|uniref:serine O-acetyltransferase n=1 Tax=Coccomyxa viridis TaxID=1274662 RepID=A0AAV1HXZ0_9CHLO|nr:hypothetical protein CVIRNUC_001689 [Coccomyxa viridis]
MGSRGLASSQHLAGPERLYVTAAPSARRHAKRPITSKALIAERHWSPPTTNGRTSFLNGNVAWKEQLISRDEDDFAGSNGNGKAKMPEVDWLPSTGWRPAPHHLASKRLWERIQQEARDDAAKEPVLASFLHQNIISHASLGKAMAVLLANKLSSRTLLGTQLMQLISDIYRDEPSILEACEADLQSCVDRDPACEKFSQCMLYFKGFQAIQCHRLNHWLWQNNRKELAVLLQSRMSEVLHVDIHPAARIGRGILMDHATGVVVGETAVVGDNVSLLHQVTLGGSGTGKGVRHPHVGHGVLLGAGVSVLGPIEIGPGSKVGAGSVVVTDLPCHCVAVGVPARIIRQSCVEEPCVNMDLVDDFILDYVI